jgi:hypothetical protein
VRIRIRDRSQLAGLVDHLERCNCTIGFHGGDLVARTGSVHDERRPHDEELELSSYLRVWTALHPDAGVELVVEKTPGKHAA